MKSIRLKYYHSLTISKQWHNKKHIFHCNAPLASPRTIGENKNPIIRNITSINLKKPNSHPHSIQYVSRISEFGETDSVLLSLFGVKISRIALEIIRWQEVRVQTPGNTLKNNPGSRCVRIVSVQLWYILWHIILRYVLLFGIELKISVNLHFCWSLFVFRVKRRTQN